MELEDLFATGNYKTGEQKISIYQAIFNGKTKDIWHYYCNQQSVENNKAALDKQLNLEALCNKILIDVIQKIFGNK